MRIADLENGIERIRLSTETQPFQLPKRVSQAAEYLPQTPAVDGIIGRQSFNDQLIGLLLPKHLDVELLRPDVMELTRIELIEHFRLLARGSGADTELFTAAVNLLAQETDMASVVGSELALLLRG